MPIQEVTDFCPLDYLGMDTYVYIYIYIFVYVCTYIYIYIYIYIDKDMFICTNIHLQACITL